MLHSQSELLAILKGSILPLNKLSNMTGTQHQACLANEPGECTFFGRSPNYYADWLICQSHSGLVEYIAYSKKRVPKRLPFAKRGLCPKGAVLVPLIFLSASDASTMFRIYYCWLVTPLPRLNNTLFCKKSVIKGVHYDEKILKYHEYSWLTEFFFLFLIDLARLYPVEWSSASLGAKMLLNIVLHSLRLKDSSWFS